MIYELPVHIHWLCNTLCKVNIILSLCFMCTNISVWFEQKYICFPADICGQLKRVKTSLKAITFVNRAWKLMSFPCIVTAIYLYLLRLQQITSGYYLNTRKVMYSTSLNNISEKHKSLNLSKKLWPIELAKRFWVFFSALCKRLSLRGTCFICASYYM